MHEKDISSDIEGEPTICSFDFLQQINSLILVLANGLIISVDISNYEVAYERKPVNLVSRWK